MFQQPDKYFNGQATQIRAEQCESHGSNQTSVQVMGMGWQQNEYGMSFDMPTTSSYEYQANWMATTGIPGSSGIQNPSSPDQPTSPNQEGSSTTANYYQNDAMSISVPKFNQQETSNLTSISNHEHQPLNDGLFKTPDSSVFAIKRERSHSAPNTANDHEANNSSRGTLNKSRHSRRRQPCKSRLYITRSRTYNHFRCA